MFLPVFVASGATAAVPIAASGKTLSSSSTPGSSACARVVIAAAPAVPPITAVAIFPILGTFCNAFKYKLSLASGVPATSLNIFALSDAVDSINFLSRPVNSSGTVAAFPPNLGFFVCSKFSMAC